MHGAVCKVEQDDENDVFDHRQPVAAQKPFNEELSSCGAASTCCTLLPETLFQATPPAAPPPSQPPQPQLAEPENGEGDEERFKARVIGCKEKRGELTWVTDYGDEWEDRFHDEPIASFEGGGLMLLHKYHDDVRVEQAMDKKVCPAPLRCPHCCLCSRHRTTTPICARLPPRLRTQVSRVR